MDDEYPVAWWHSCDLQMWVLILEFIEIYTDFFQKYFVGVKCLSFESDITLMLALGALLTDIHPVLLAECAVET